MTTRYFDSHSHLQLESFDGEREQVVQRAKDAGVDQWMIVAIDAETARKAIQFCQQYDHAYPTAGLHPHQADDILDQEQQIKTLIQKPSVVAVGETGLDFYKEYSPATQQEESVNRHIDMALEVEKPIIFHCRDAHDELVRILQRQQSSLDEVFPDRSPGVIHCFSGNKQHLEAYQEMGFYVSFSGIVTFPNAEDVQEAAAAASPEHLLVETDCPFLAPQAYRGKQNEPAYLPETVKKIAELQGEDPGDIARTTRENTKDLFGLSSE